MPLLDREACRLVTMIAEYEVARNSAAEKMGVMESPGVQIARQMLIDSSEEVIETLKDRPSMDTDDMSVENIEFAIRLCRTETERLFAAEAEHAGPDYLWRGSRGEHDVERRKPRSEYDDFATMRIRIDDVLDSLYEAHHDRTCDCAD